MVPSSMADTATGTGGAVLTARAVRLGLRATDKWDAINKEAASAFDEAKKAVKE